MAANFDKAAQIWSIPWKSDWVSAVTFAGSARRLVAGNLKGELVVWDLPEAVTDQPVAKRRLDGHDNSITNLAPLAEKNWIVSTSYDRTVRWWDLEAAATGKAELVLVPADPKKTTPAAKEAPPTMVEVLQAAHVDKSHRDWIRGLAVSKGRMLTGDDSGLAIVWDMKERKEALRLQVAGWLTGLALAPDASRAVTCEFTTRYATFKNAAQIWDLGSAKPRADLSKECPNTAVAAFSHDGKYIALGTGGEIDAAKIILVDTENGKKIREMPGHRYGVNGVVFHPDGKHLLSCGRDTAVRIWQVDDGKLVQTLGKPRGGQFTDWTYAISLSPDGQWLATADMGGFVQVWRLHE